MRTLRILSVGALIALLLPFATSAATLAELQSQLAQLMAQIAAMQAQQGTPSTPSQPTSATQCPNLTRTLSRGYRGTDVTSLQTFLIQQGHLAAGNASGYFGVLTEAAVKKFQCAKNIVCAGNPASTGYGLVGARTRAAIANCTTQPTQPISPQPTPQPITYSWQAGGWSTCANSQQSRTVSCISSTNATVADSFCTQTKPAAIQTCSTITQSQSCSFNNQTVAHGASVTAYQSSSAPYGGQCVSQQRTCTNGALSGSYTNAACTVSAAASCTFNGQTVQNGASVTAYQSSSATQCISQTRTCTNGTLSGSYTNASCSVPAEQTMDLSTPAQGTYSLGFDTFLFPFALSAPVTFTGVSGNISSLQANPVFSETLGGIYHLPDAMACPSTMQFIPSGDTSSAAYNTYRNLHYLAQVILKTPDGGYNTGNGLLAATPALNISLPFGIPTSKCIIVALNGGAFGDHYYMASHLTMRYVSAPPPVTPTILGLGDEFCLGWSNPAACSGNQSVDTSKEFGNIVGITAAGKLAQLYGNISNSAFDGSPFFGPPPTGAWSTTDEWWLVNNCAPSLQGYHNNKDVKSMLPVGSSLLMSITQSGFGKQALQKEVNQTFSNVSVDTTKCIAHILKLSTAPGDTNGVAAETQVIGLVVPN